MADVNITSFSARLNTVIICPIGLPWSFMSALVYLAWCQQLVSHRLVGRVPFLGSLYVLALIMVGICLITLALV